jgi:hypothetical protein
LYSENVTPAGESVGFPENPVGLRCPLTDSSLANVSGVVAIDRRTVENRYKKIHFALGISGRLKAFSD